MKNYFLLPFLFVTCLAGCKTTKPDTPPVSDLRTEAYTEDGHSLPVQQPDVSRDLNAFLAQLRTAVAAKDMHTIASMMTPSFGYQLNPVREGEGVFQYWDEHGLWGELELVVKDNFSPLGDFHVAPTAFAMEPETYSGYRAGVIQTKRGWKFAYFVTD